MPESLITTRYCDLLPNEYVNNLTKEMDKHVTFPEGLNYGSPTYILKYKTNDSDKDVFVLRFPGATRGHIVVDDSMVIREIHLYEDTCFKDGLGCYHKTVLGAIPSFIGKQMVFDE